MSDVPQEIAEKIQAPIVARWQREEAEHQRRMAEEPEYRAAEEKRAAAAEASKRRDEERRQRELDASRAADFRERGVPELYIPRGFAWQSTAALEHAKAYHERRDLFLVLAGPPGVGKTAALAWLVRKGPVLSRGVDYHTGAALEWGGDPPRFITANRLARTDRYDSEAMESLESGCELLAVDDAGAELLDRVGAFVTLLDAIANERYARRLRLAISTNLNAKQFRERFGERLIDRVREVGSFVELKGPSLRARGKGSDER